MLVLWKVTLVVKFICCLKVDQEAYDMIDEYYCSLVAN